MGVDMRNSNELTEGFRKKTSAAETGGLEMTVKVLTTGLWNEQKNTAANSPHSCYVDVQHLRNITSQGM
jgi:hypothetical protein